MEKYIILQQEVSLGQCDKFFSGKLEEGSRTSWRAYFFFSFFPVLFFVFSFPLFFSDVFYFLFSYRSLPIFRRWLTYTYPLKHENNTPKYTQPKASNLGWCRQSVCVLFSSINGCKPVTNDRKNKQNPKPNPVGFRFWVKRLQPVFPRYCPTGYQL